MEIIKLSEMSLMEAEGRPYGRDMPPMAARYVPLARDMPFGRDMCLRHEKGRADMAAAGCRLYEWIL